MDFEISYTRADQTCSVTEHYSMAHSREFYDRLIDLLGDVDVIISKITMGQRKVQLLWSGVVELP